MLLYRFYQFIFLEYSLNMTYSGEVAKVLSVFAIVFIMIIVLHFVMLTIQYTVAGSLSGRNPFALMKTMAPAYLTALGTQSSAATIPVTLAQARKTGASARVTDFSIPLFATIHLSGSTITLVSCSIGVMLMNGMPIEFVSYLTIHFYAWRYDDCSSRSSGRRSNGSSWPIKYQCLGSTKQWLR